MAAATTAGSFLQIDLIPAVPFETGEANEMDTFAKVALGPSARPGPNDFTSVLPPYPKVLLGLNREKAMRS